MLSFPSLSGPQLVLLSLLSLPAAFVLKRVFATAPPSPSEDADKSEDESTGTDDKTSSIMQAENSDLAPPRDDPFTLEQLKAFDGRDPEKPIYVSIKGDVFDVTKKKDMYGPGKSYNIFAGKDGSRGLGMSSLKDEDAVPDYTTLSDTDRKVLDDWHAFFLKRYNVVGRVSDLPEAVARL
ncbi:hypothetical protein M0805_003555 [Coniferiporia weirii]|nr:hypothetical protein M0805_003555 [Coniferiporia weirii]